MEEPSVVADVQPDKFVRIASIFLEELCNRLIPFDVLQVLLVVIRKTWGFNQKKTHLKLEDFMDLTGMREDQTSRAISRGIKLNILGRSGKQKHYVYWVQKDFDKWLVGRRANFHNLAEVPRKLDSTAKDSLTEEPRKLGRSAKQKPRKPASKKGKRDPINTFININNKQLIYSEEFEIFWKKYPNKRSGKQAAFQSFLKAFQKNPELTLGDLLFSLNDHIENSPEWARDYIPYATTWLNQGRWTADFTEEDDWPDDEEGNGAKQRTV